MTSEITEIIWVNDSQQITNSTSMELKPDLLYVWIYGIISIASISLLSLLGLAFRPFAKKRWYKNFLLFLMSISVGILSATAILFLLPDAINLDMDDDSIRNNFINKTCVLFATIFLFFNFEIIFKRTVKWKTEVKHRKLKTSKLLAMAKERDVELDKASIVAMAGDDSAGDMEEWAVRPRLPEAALAEERLSSSGEPTHSSDTSLVWVILAGDSIHSFVDGMAIGIAMTQNLLEGVGVALVIFVEEFPHKLGDIAVLLNCGMRLGRAVVYCFLASIPAFVGFICGVFVGHHVESATSWVFAVATALFLYVAFVDILPEVVERIDAETEAPAHQQRPQSSSPAAVDQKCRPFNNARKMEQKDDNFFHMFISLRRLPIADTGMVIGFLISMLICSYADKIQLNKLSTTQ